MVEWVVLELTPKGEKESPEVIRKSVTRVLRGAEVYVPAVETQVGEDKVIYYLVQGYAFVRKDRQDKDYFRLDGGKYVQAVLLASGATSGRRVGTVPETYIDEMREKARAEANQGIGIGDTVRICSGPYRNLEATVITEIPEEKKVQVFVQLLSKETILTLPRSVLDVVNRAPLSSFFARAGYLRAWAQMAKVILAYQGDPQHLKRLKERHDEISHWVDQGSKLYAFTRSYSSNFETKVGTLVNRCTHLTSIEAWLIKGRRLFSFVYWQGSSHRLDELLARYQVLSWFDEVDQRLRDLSMDVEAVARRIALGNKDKGEMIQNVLIDGHNLAFRCLYAPGISDLVDDQGRPTGVILGFLRSLGALKKRYPEAKFWVAWDGSSKRRKSQYPDYKSQRKKVEAVDNPSFDQFDFLRTLLPMFGVRQVWNPEEEADDVLATLVRGQLSAQRNLLYSTDRDLLQLVTGSTMLLVPSTNSRREVLYDEAEVQKAMGVPPEQVVQLRAFFGDASDNLPGVPRVPKKILRALVKSHGSVAGVYSSGLAGVTKNQYERLRSSEPQVKINANLMELLHVDVSEIAPDVDVNEASARLSSLKIKPTPIVQSFFGDTSET